MDKNLCPQGAYNIVKNLKHATSSKTYLGEEKICSGETETQGSVHKNSRQAGQMRARSHTHGHVQGQKMKPVGDRQPKEIPKQRAHFH